MVAEYFEETQPGFYERKYSRVIQELSEDTGPYYFVDELSNTVG